MKNFKLPIVFIAVFAMLFTSCSKEESIASDLGNEETFQIQFGTLLNDIESKAHGSLPGECRDATPSYVMVGIENSDGIYIGPGGGTTTPSLFRIELKNNNGSWETTYSEALGLPAGNYSLEYFIVYDTEGQVLWVAPREGGDYASSVGEPLPQAINLAAGTKPYINVDVLCFIPRDEEAYGYLFFDIELTTVENNYCIFVNFCDDETGREYPALFQVDVWADAYGGSDVVIDGKVNSVSGTGNSFAATVLCFPLPPLEGDDTYFVRVTVLSSGAYTADASDFVQFQINQSDIDAQLTETPRYEHLRINCNPSQEEPFCTPTTTNVSSCNFFCEGGIYGFLSNAGNLGANGFVYVTPSNFGNTFKLYKTGTTTSIADVRFEFNASGDLRVKFTNVDGTITAFEIDARLPRGSSAPICNDTRCNDDCVHNDDFTEKLEGDVITPSILANGGFYIKVRVQQGDCPS